MKGKDVLTPFKTQATRDLRWLLRSPSLMNHKMAIDASWGQQMLAENPGLLKRFDKDDSVLNQRIKHQKNNRLGLYFEILLNTWLSELPTARILFSNRQVQGNSGTIGEFDLVFQQNRRVWHWELAIKFYLGYSDPDCPHQSGRWYGPNARDALDKKWSKMLDHQLRLSQYPQAQSILDNARIKQKIIPRAFIKGFLFEAINPRFRRTLPPDANNECLCGWWVHHHQLKTYKKYLDPEESLLWIEVPRLRWLSPVLSTPQDLPKIFSTFATDISAERPAFVVGMVQTPHGLCEVTRGFIVPNTWPNDGAVSHSPIKS